MIRQGEWSAYKNPTTGTWLVKVVYMADLSRITAWPAACDSKTEDNEAHARLFATAPDLLAFVQRAALRDPIYAKGHEKQIIKDARALVVRAGGAL